MSIRRYLSSRAIKSNILINIIAGILRKEKEEDLQDLILNPIGEEEPLNDFLHG